MKEKILIVEDNDVNLDIFEEIFEDDFAVKMVNDGQQALDVVAEYMPKLIVLDVMMPNMDGYEVCRRIRADENLKHIKIIMVSARAMEAERKKGIEIGADEYVTKPFDQEALLELVKSYVN